MMTVLRKKRKPIRDWEDCINGDEKQKIPDDCRDADTLHFISDLIAGPYEAA